MNISGWGKYPVVDAEVLAPRTVDEAAALVRDGADFTGIARGLGRSYGDSVLAARTISIRYLDHLIDFDAATGMLRRAASR